jgi:hypothetical protein
MKHTAKLLILLAGVGGCASVEDGGAPSTAPWANGPQGPVTNASSCPGNAPPRGIPGVSGWDQTPMPMAAPYTAAPPRTAAAAQEQIWNSVPMDPAFQRASFNPAAGDRSMLQAAGGPGMDGGIRQAGQIPAPYMPAGGGFYPPAAVAGVGMNTPGGASPFQATRTEVRFSAPSGMMVSWFTPGPDGKNASRGSIAVPGRYNFNQGAIYRLKLSDIPGRQGLELYPTLDVVPSNSRTSDFLAHSAVPISFTEDDFDQVISGNYVVKVIYLPDPQYQDLANPGGAGEVVSTRLEAGVDPIAQAASRGNILLVIRMGNIDLEAPNTPAMDAPNPNAPKQPAMPRMGGFPGIGTGMGGGAGPNMMVPYGAMGTGMPGMPGAGMISGGPGMPMAPGPNPYGPAAGGYGPGGPMMPPGAGPNGYVPPGYGQAPVGYPGGPALPGGGTLPPAGVPTTQPGGFNLPPAPGIQGSNLPANGSPSAQSTNWQMPPAVK